MKLYHTLPDNKGLFVNPVVTIGNFDGVHIGHRKIFTNLLDIARKVKGDALVITFSTHPRKILYPDSPISIITTTEEKVNAIFNIGISNIILLNFTREMANMHAEEFFNEVLLKRIDAKEIVIGYDHAFGKNREGNIDFLTDIARINGINLTKVEEEKIGSRPVSSSWLRRVIQDGDITLANKLLGRRLTITGKVVKGAGRGLKLGYPTANIAPENRDKILPRDGAYAATVLIGDEVWKGMLNIGCNPTFSNQVRSIEMHIFDFDRDIYDETVTVHLYDRIREEMAFGTAGDLAEQLGRDREKAMRIFMEHN